MNLSTENAQLYFRLYFSLLAFANRQLKVISGVAAPGDVRKRPREQVIKLRDALHAEPAVLERYITENPERFSAQDLAIAASWRHRITGDFLVMRHLKPYTVFMSTEEPTHLYGVLGLIDPIDTVLRSRPLPVILKTVLLPFRDKVVYDGLITTYSVSLGRNLLASFKETYSRLKEREGIVEQLVGPTGDTQIQTSLAWRRPRKPAPDWRPAIEEIVVQTDKMRRADTKLQGAALALLRATAHLNQAAFLNQGAELQIVRCLRSVHTALARLERQLYEEHDSE